MKRYTLPKIIVVKVNAVRPLLAESIPVKVGDTPIDANQGLSKDGAFTNDWE